MFIEIVPAGIYAVNCYIIADSNKVGAVIDPGGSADRIMKAIEENGIEVKYIIATHGHGDHIGAIEELRARTGAKFIAHELEKEILNDKEKNLTACMGVEHVEIEADEYVKEGDIVEVGELSLEIIHTPGHTPGGMCIRTGEYLFTGDTLFALSVGRSDLYGGDFGKLQESLKKLKGMDDHLKVLPGHGSASTLKTEKKRNSYMNEV